MGEAETIAKGLDDGLKRAILMSHDGVFPTFRDMGKLANAARSLGLLNVRGHLNKKGLAVRRHLLEGADNAEG